MRRTYENTGIFYKRDFLELNDFVVGILQRTGVEFQVTRTYHKTDFMPGFSYNVRTECYSFLIELTRTKNLCTLALTLDNTVTDRGVVLFYGTLMRLGVDFVITGRYSYSFNRVPDMLIISKAVHYELINRILRAIIAPRSSDYTTVLETLLVGIVLQRNCEVCNDLLVDPLSFTDFKYEDDESVWKRNMGAVVRECAKYLVG